jgi:hypothetical protein
MTISSLVLNRKKLNYKVLTFNNKESGGFYTRKMTKGIELRKFFTFKVANAYAISVNGVVLSM